MITEVSPSKKRNLFQYSPDTKSAVLHLKKDLVNQKSPSTSPEEEKKKRSIEETTVVRNISSSSVGNRKKCKHDHVHGDVEDDDMVEDEDDDDDEKGEEEESEGSDDSSEDDDDVTDDDDDDLAAASSGTTTTTSLADAIFGKNNTSKEETLSSSSSIFSTPNASKKYKSTSSISSIFDAVSQHDNNNNNNSFNDSLFSTSTANKFKQATEKRVQQNREKHESTINLDNHSNALSMSNSTKTIGTSDKSTSTSTTRCTTLTRNDVIALRKKRTIDSHDAVNAITVQVNSINEYEDETFFVGQSDAIFRQHGVLIVSSSSSSSSTGRSTAISKKSSHVHGENGLFSKSLLESLSNKAKEIQHEICQRLNEEGHVVWQIPSNITPTTNQPNQKLGDDDPPPTQKQPTSQELQKEKDLSFRYQEVASRCQGRLDIRHGMNKEPFTDDELTCNDVLMPLIRSLLGKDVKLVYAGLILSFGGSVDQPWHQDGTALFEEDAYMNTKIDLPPYALNIFIPLEDVSEEKGPTEFFLGSHLGCRAREIMSSMMNGHYDDGSNGGDGDKGKEGIGGKAIGPILKMGDVLIYDYRVCHRGTSNLSTVVNEDGAYNNKGADGDNDDGGVRPMLYLMYARPWFQEHLNFGEKRLFDGITNYTYS